MTEVAPCGCLAAKLDSCNRLLSSVHTLLVNILRCIRLYIKRTLKMGPLIMLFYKEGLCKSMDLSFFFSCWIERYHKWFSRVFLITLIAEKVDHDSRQ